LSPAIEMPPCDQIAAGGQKFVAGGQIVAGFQIVAGGQKVVVKSTARRAVRCHKDRMEYLAWI
jgi:hypothetical protein